MASLFIANGPRHAVRTSGLDRRGRVLVSTLALAGLALLLNRGNLPASLLVEYYWFGNPTWEKFIERPVARFQDQSILLVSDSMLLSAPWQADLLGARAKSSANLTTLFVENIGDRHYDCIVLWTGTWDWMVDNPVDATVESIAALVTALQQHADRVVVLGVMPHLRSDGAYRPSVRQAQDITTRIKERCGAADVVDVLPIHYRALREGRRSALYSDGVHLTVEGFRVLADLLAGQDVRLEEDPKLVEGARLEAQRRDRERDAVSAFDAGR